VDYVGIMFAVKADKFPSKVMQKDDGKEYIIQNNKNESRAHVMGWHYNLKLDRVILPEIGLQFYDGISNGDLFNIFYKKEYEFLPVRDRVVIDIGANIADSSIYFAMNGAKKVIALEPFPKNFEIAEKNIAMNGFTDKIELINAGCCGGHNKDIILDASAKGASCQTIQSSMGSNIHFFTLGELIDKYNIDSHAILKLDCEGCEYDIIFSNSNTGLHKFSHIQIEYHHGFRDLKKHLIDGSFAVSHTNPEIKNGMEIGWIYAHKS
jgi:FkbM family methyltransferase